ncbi:glycosyltransferase [Nocardia sp. NPDC051321]|uniref:glycosyltransferase n=1 Tax=Nocardia sp. NPDC051321 TaxID=3364323 RepID=UPI0037B7120B
MRVLCSTTPMEGVFAPALPLLTELVRAGHEVLVATAPDLADRVRATGLPTALAGPPAPVAAGRAVTDPVFADGVQPWRIGAVMFARIMAPEKLPELSRIAAEFRPDLILQPPVDLAAPIVAATLGIPSITYGTGLLLESELMAAMAEWVAPLWDSSGLAPDPHAGMYRTGYLDPVPAALQPDRGPAAKCARPIRPHVPGSPAEVLPDWMGQLGDRPVVYFSLGTVPIFNQPSMFEPVLRALADLAVEAIVTVGRTNDPAAFGPLPDSIHLEQWLPLAAVLPRCDAVVCHGGAGTTLAALSHGLPLLLLPRGADQFPTAAACRSMGAAQVLPPDVGTTDAVRAGIEAMLTDASYTAAAARLKSEIDDMPSPAVVAGGLTGVVRRKSWKTWSTR